MASPATEPRPLYELIYDVLKEHLKDESFPRGLVFGDSIVARAFGSSRIPAAAALQRLKAEGWLKGFDGRGYIAAGADPDEVFRAELTDVGLHLPSAVASSLEVRNHHGRIYPKVEHTIAASLAFGKFLVNESALAEHYGVSRTVAHEVLTRLERVGLIFQDRNQRWYAGPLTIDRLRNYFEMRWLLEPVALGQSMEMLQRKVVEARRLHVARAMGRSITPRRFERLETELHVDTVLAHANGQMVDAIRRNQVALIPTHSTFAMQPHAEELELTLAEHREIFDFILVGNKRCAMGALERHIRRALEPNIERLRRLTLLPDSLRVPYLVPVKY